MRLEKLDLRETGENLVDYMRFDYPCHSMSLIALRKIQVGNIFYARLSYAR